MAKCRGCGGNFGCGCNLNSEGLCTSCRNKATVTAPVPASVKKTNYANN